MIDKLGFCYPFLYNIHGYLVAINFSFMDTILGMFTLRSNKIFFNLNKAPQRLLWNILAIEWLDLTTNREIFITLC